MGQCFTLCHYLSKKMVFVHTISVMHLINHTHIYLTSLNVPLDSLTQGIADKQHPF